MDSIIISPPIPRMWVGTRGAGVYLYLALDQIDDPVNRDTWRCVNLSLLLSIVSQRRVGRFDDDRDVLGLRMIGHVAPRWTGHNREIRFRLATVSSNGRLNTKLPARRQEAQ